jgi:hypothetical protein
LLTAVKLPVLTAVEPAGVDLVKLCVARRGLDTPLWLLFDKGLSCSCAGSGMGSGANEKREMYVDIGGMFSKLPGPAGYSDLSDLLGQPLQLTSIVL